VGRQSVADPGVSVVRDKDRRVDGANKMAIFKVFQNLSEMRALSQSLSFEGEFDGARMGVAKLSEGHRRGGDGFFFVRPSIACAVLERSERLGWGGGA
jgi:hypothetical protein